MDSVRGSTGRISSVRSSALRKNSNRPPPNPARPATRPASPFDNFEEDTVIMAHDATNGIDKPDILDDK